jgi:hypothetical protein
MGSREGREVESTREPNPAPLLHPQSGLAFRHASS